MMETVARYALYFFFYSAVGWFFESCYCSLTPRKWVNRGFLTGPLCPIYGTGALVFMICVNPVKNIAMTASIAGRDVNFTPAAVFLVGLVLADIVEFTVSLLMEKLFHARWWDYSNRFLNLQGRICFRHSIYWGLACVGFLYVLHPFIDSYFSRVQARFIYYFLVIVLAVFVIDVFDAVKKALDVRKLMDKLRDATGYITSLLSGALENAIALGYEEANAASEKLAKLRADGAAQLAEIKASFERLSRGTKREKGEKKNRMFGEFPMMRENARAQIESIEAKIEELLARLNNR